MRPDNEIVIGAVKASPGVAYSWMYFSDKPIEWWTTLFTFVYIFSLVVHFYWTKVLSGWFKKGVTRWKAWRKARREG